MQLPLHIRAVQSLQSFTPDIEDEVVVHGTVLGVQVTVRSPNAELLHKIDEFLVGLAQESEQVVGHTEYTEGVDYRVGGLDDD